MVEIRFAGKEDRARWDEYILAHPEASPYHLYAWRDAIEEAYKKKAYYLIAEEEKTVVGVLPLIYMRCKTITNELTGLAFCDVGNSLFNDEDIADKLLSKAIELGKQLKVNKINLRGHVEFSDYGQRVFSLDSCNKVRMFMDLPESSELLMKSFKSKLRSQIRKAEKNGISFHWGTREDIDEFYGVFSQNMRELGSPVHSKDLFVSILSHFGDNVGMGLVRVDNKPIGCGILLMLGDKICIPWASTLREFNHLASSMYLYWNFLKYSCDNGYREFDFGRSSLDGGTYRFKYQWGARPTKLEWYSAYLNKGKADNDLTKSNRRQSFEKIWPKLPLSVTNYLGPKIRKHISY